MYLFTYKTDPNVLLRLITGLWDYKNNQEFQIVKLETNLIIKWKTLS